MKNNFGIGLAPLTPAPLPALIDYLAPIASRLSPIPMTAFSPIAINSVVIIN